ncbi:putative ARM repeat-containing protein [Rosellinia necatrix]|uniref:Putative ARM repeat-containing protein n=1 Tax=Rosellinia necatrix TaxID=77044 RepID=A0A1W2TSF9_ROSNE|nr:putative ARM repeat-containing protein [Rosellinia necatrix]
MSGFINQLFDNIPDDEVQQTKALCRVADISRNLWKTDPGSPDLDLLARRVGDAARAESNRAPLGESGLLEFFCSVVSAREASPALVVQCLRIIGNSSADQDENRARVIASGCVPSIVSLLSDDSMLAFVIPVLFNISVDYEPAQQAIYQAGINPELVGLISGPRLEDAAALQDYVCKLLGFVATQEPEANLVHPATPFALLSLANNQPLPLDAKDFLGPVSVALTYLAQEQFQQAFLEAPGSVNIILRTFSTVCGQIGVSEEDADDEAQLKQVQTAFTATLADLSAQPLFASSCPLDGPEVQTLQHWISAPHIPLQSAACLALGNLARSDETCGYLVRQRAVHEPLVAILADPARADAGLLHSVLGFLKNLAIPAGNKAVLGGAGLLRAGVLPRIWGLDAQTQVQFDAVSLARLLLVGCAENVRRICAPLDNDDDNDDDDNDDGNGGDDGDGAPSPAPPRSKLHLLIDLNARSDQEPTQMETARAIAAVCRVLHSAPDSPPPPPPSRLPSISTFYSAHGHGAVADALFRLGPQAKFPVLRSELLFVFALMARSPDGAAAVAAALRRPESVGFFAEVVTGEKATTTPTTKAAGEEGDHGHGGDAGGAEQDPAAPSSSSSSSSSALLADIVNAAGLEARSPIPAAPPAAAAAAAGGGVQNTTARDVDRENALVLVAELLRRCPDGLPAATARAFRDLLREGGERLLRQRAGDGRGG